MPEFDTKGSDSLVSKHASANAIIQSDKERTDSVPSIESTPSSQSVINNTETSSANPIDITGKQWSTNARTTTTGKASTKPGIDSSEIPILGSQKDVTDGGIIDSISAHAPVSTYKTQNNPGDYLQKGNQQFYNHNKQKLTNVSPTAVGTPKQLIQGQQYGANQHEQILRQSARLSHHPHSQHMYQSANQSQRVDALTNPNMVNHSISMSVNMTKSNLALSNPNYNNSTYVNKKMEYQSIDPTHHSLLSTAVMHAQQSQSPGMHSQAAPIPWQVEQTNNPVQSSVGLRGPTVHDGINQVQTLSYIDKQHKPHGGSYEGEVSPIFGNPVDSLNNSNLSGTNPRVPSPGVNAAVGVNIQNSSYRDYTGQNFTSYPASQQLTTARNFNMQPTVSTLQAFVMPMNTVVANSNQAIGVVNPQQGNISMAAGTTRPIGQIHSTAGMQSVPYRPASIGSVVGQTNRIAPDVQGMDQIVAVSGMQGIIPNINNQQGQLQVRPSKNPNNRGNKSPFERQNGNNMQRQKQRGDAYRYRKG